MIRSSCPRVGTPARHRLTRHRPKLERLESRLPPGDALLGLLFASSFASLSTNGGELTSLDGGGQSFEITDLADTGITPRSAVARKSVSSTAETEQVELAPTRECTLDAGPLTSSPERSHDVGRLAVTQAGPGIAAQSAMIASAGFQASAAPHPAFAHAAFTSHALAVGEPMTPAPADEAQKSQALDNYGKLPLTFEANHGQTDSRVDFITRAGGATVFLTPTSAVFGMQQRSPDLSGGRKPPEPQSPQGAYAPRSESGNVGVAIHMQIVGANPDATPVAQERQPGIVNYFIGNDPSQWHANVPTFGRVAYQDVYPGIDLVYYSSNGQLEYDFVVSPGANPSAITLNFAGADGVEINPHGDLVLHTAVGDVVQQKPLVYQEAAGTRQEVASRFVLSSDPTSHDSAHSTQQVSFDLGTYDATRPLVIDPVVGYSTFLGGAGVDSGGGIAVDGSGNAYVMGTTQSSSFPTTPGAFDTSYNGGGLYGDVFVTKLNAAGSALVYSTFLGGSQDDYAGGIAVDASGNAYLGGTTQSSNFPTTAGAFDTTFNGGTYDAFVTKLNAAGSALVYSTFLGGSDTDWGFGIAVNSGGNAYVTGYTYSSNFPTTPAFDTTYNGVSDAFVTALSGDGSGLAYSTFLGGSQAELAIGIAVDASLNAYVTGFTNSSNFPTTPGAFDTTYNGGVSGDSFVVKLSPSGTSLAYATYLGGATGQDIGEAIALDTSGSAYVSGLTQSSDFPTTPGTFDTTFNGTGDVFVAKLSASGSTLFYSTYLGGSGDDTAIGIAVDRSGNAYVTGQTASSNFPTTPAAFDNTFNGGGNDAFVTKFSPGGTKLVYSTFLGGTGGDGGSRIAVGPGVHVTGYTNSSDFPTQAGSFDTTYNGGYDAFVTKLNLPRDPFSQSPQDVLINNNAGSTGTAFFTQSETTLVAFGSTVVVGFNDSGSVNGASKFTGWSRSTNGGATFTDGGTLPTNSGGDLGDPSMARSDSTGRIFFATMGFNISTIQVFQSDDGGATWSAPVNGTPGGDDEDKEWITVDNFPGAGQGNVYLVARDFGAPDGIYFFRSTNNGNTFGPSGGTLIASGGAGNVQGPFVTVGPDHAVYVFYFDESASPETIKVRKSTDRGATFGPAVTVANLDTGPGFNGDLGLTGRRQGDSSFSDFRSSAFPHAAVNPVNGNIYVTYANDAFGADKADVFLVRSTDGGASWSVPTRVNDDATTTTDQWMPTLAVTPDGTKLGIFYYSRQEDTASNNLFRYYGRIADIAGSTVTFRPSFPISDVASLPEFGRDVINPVYMGDYNFAAATNTAFQVVWSDNRADLPGGAPRKDPNVYYDRIATT